MSALAIPPLDSPIPTAPSKSADPAKARDAAQQFEALLISQLLRSARAEGSGWLGAPGESSSDCATDYAEQQFAAVMAHAGGLGIAAMVARGLGNSSTPAPSTAPPSLPTARSQASDSPHSGK